MEMFDEMSKNNLSPDRYYLICCIRDSVTPIGINLHLEMRRAISDGWLVMSEDNTKANLTPKAHSLVDGIEKLFSIQKKKTNTQLLGRGFKDKIIAYNEIFPNEKNASGKAARSSPKNLEATFRWFFENYNYSWETIFIATKYYVAEQAEIQDSKFRKSSQYFIRKDNLSALADYCYAYETDGFKDNDQTKDHVIKVL